MKRLSAHLLDRLTRLNRLMLIGIILLGCTPLVYGLMTRPLMQRLHDLRTSTAQPQATTIRTVTTRTITAPVSPRESMRRFYQGLPPQSAIPDLMEKIFDAAYDNSLSPEQGEFKLTPSTDARFSRYQISLPVTGTYPNVRKFLHRAMAEIPTLSLDEISFSREDARQPEVDIKLRLSIYLRSAP